MSKHTLPTFPRLKRGFFLPSPLLSATIAPLCHKIDSLKWFLRAMPTVLERATSTTRRTTIKTKKTRAKNTKKRNTTQLQRHTLCTSRRSNTKGWPQSDHPFVFPPLSLHFATIGSEIRKTIKLKALQKCFLCHFHIFIFPLPCCLRWLFEPARE